MCPVTSRSPTRGQCCTRRVQLLRLMHGALISLSAHLSEHFVDPLSWHLHCCVSDERTNRALADAVERHATKDPGMRGILKRASVVCDPESEPQKKNALDTEQDSTPHPSVSNGGSSASGTRPCNTTSTDQNTGTGDVRTGPTQGVSRASSSDDIGDDVAMRRDNAEENRAEHLSSSGSDRRRIITKRGPCEARDAQTSVTEQHVPRVSGKTMPSEHPVAVTTQEALGG